VRVDEEVLGSFDPDARKEISEGQARGSLEQLAEMEQAGIGKLGNLVEAQVFGRTTGKPVAWVKARPNSVNTLEFAIALSNFRFSSRARNSPTT